MIITTGLAGDFQAFLKRINGELRHDFLCDQVAHLAIILSQSVGVLIFDNLLKPIVNAPNLLRKARQHTLRPWRRFERVGGAKRDRTADLLHAMQALSQLSYGPKPLGA